MQSKILTLDQLKYKMCLYFTNSFIVSCVRCVGTWIAFYVSRPISEFVLYGIGTETFLRRANSC